MSASIYKEILKYITGICIIIISVLKIQKIWDEQKKLLL